MDYGIRQRPQPGEVWHNTKNKQLYHIKEIATNANNSGSSNSTVIYANAAEEPYSRDLEEFMGTRETDEGAYVWRFVKVGGSV